ncbi:MAG: hypothetical protein GX095_05810 [Clostridiales bacterium]|jgi:hypothetical protein|nr:hypothetical protein [Clostridiales bacterium]HOK81406.1 hypothetical protein [Clostridia bacterium]HOL60706.1 hypothetical protein [Clostridia bacterium]HPO53281.1 hypothetical protein [Clostridia bacterium]
MAIDIFNHLRLPKQFLKPRANGSEAAKSTLKDGTIFWDIAAQEGALCGYSELKTDTSEGTISYGKNKSGHLILLRHINFPFIPIKPNKKFSSFAYNFTPKAELMLDGVEIKNEKPVSAAVKDSLTVVSNFMNGATVTRSFYPSVRYPAFIEKIEVTNNTKSKVTFTASELKNRLTDKSKALKKVSFGLSEKLIAGARLVDGNGDFRNHNMVDVKKLLVPGATAVCYIVYYAVKQGKTLNFNAEKEIRDYLKSKSANNQDT